MPPRPSNTSEISDIDEAPLKGTSLDYVLPNPPPFTLRQIKDAIPAHCFEHSLLTSFGYVAHDFLFTALFMYLGIQVDSLDVPMALKIALWSVCVGIQGLFMTGIWMLGHECGHGGFSSSPAINAVVGTITHSLVGVPFFSWKYSHAAHHHFCCHVEFDEAFVPQSRHELGPEADQSVKYSTFGRLVYVFIFFTMGFPLYLTFHFVGRNYSPEWVNHFNPYASLFRPKQRVGVVVSDIALAVVAFGVYTFYQRYGLLWICLRYIFPYMIVNAFLATITLLQHTDTFVPHYRSGEWNSLRGALGTVDRSFGRTLDYLFHHIADTHVVHHIFSDLPFYNAVEATKAVAPLLGKYRLTDFETPILRAVWNAYNDCLFVPDEGDVVFLESFAQRNPANVAYQRKSRKEKNGKHLDEEKFD